MEEIYIRNYEHSDANRCAEISLAAWPIFLKIADYENAIKFMQLYIDISVISSNYLKVCCINDTVVGLLFGESIKLPYKKKLTEKKKEIIYDFIKRKYGKINSGFSFIAGFLLTEFIVAILSRKFESQIVLFMVDKSQQRKGIGTILLNKYLKELIENNCKNLYLYTDTESNWEYYERHEFKKYKEFYDFGLSILKREKTYSFLYYRNL